MPTDFSRTFTLTRQHFEVLERVMKTMKVDESEANRIIYNHAINSERSLGIPALDEDRRMKKLELDMLDSKMSAMRNAFQHKSKNPVSELESRKKPSGASALRKKSPEEIVDNYKDDIGRDTPTGRMAMRHVRKAIAIQPDLLAKLPEGKRKLIEAGGE